MSDMAALLSDHVVMYLAIATITWENFLFLYRNYIRQ